MGTTRRGETTWMVVLSLAFTLMILILAWSFAPRGEASDAVPARYETLSYVTNAVDAELQSA